MKKTCSNCIHLLKSNKCKKHNMKIEKTDRGMGCFDDGSTKMYKSREYCRDIECDIQQMIDDPGIESNEQAKQYCRDICDAYKFHKWLKDNNYKIKKVK